VESSCECGYEPSGSIKFWETIECPNMFRTYDQREYRRFILFVTALHVSVIRPSSSTHMCVNIVGF
jgi:hypothetical protein